MPRKNPGNRKPHAPNAAAKLAMKGAFQPRDMRRNDPWCITAPVDTTYRYCAADYEVYVERTTDDRLSTVIARTNRCETLEADGEEDDAA